MEVNAWIKSLRQRHVTKKDLERMIDRPVKMLILDWDYEQNTIWDHKPNELLNPLEVLIDTQGIMTYKGNGCWNIFLSSCGEDVTAVYVNNKGNQYTMVQDDGFLYNKCPCCDKTATRLMHWDDVPDNTRVGWRGPMIIWEDVPGTPQIFWEDSSEELKVPISHL